MSFSHVPPVELLPGALYQMFADVSCTGTIQEGDRYGLMAACFNDNLEEEERLVVNRLIRSIVRGKISVA